jgi:hypothetical protein
MSSILYEPPLTTQAEDAALDMMEDSDEGRMDAEHKKQWRERIQSYRDEDRKRLSALLDSL